MRCSFSFHGGACAEGSYPLTPSLSPGEREHVTRSFDKTGRLDLRRGWRRFSLSLRERAGVRGNAISTNPSVSKCCVSLLMDHPTGGIV